MLDTVLGAPLIVSSCGPRNGMVGRTGAILCEDGAGTVYAVRVTATRRRAICVDRSVPPLTNKQALVGTEHR